MFSGMTREQRQRKAALRAARQLCRTNAFDPTPEVVLKMAEFILTGTVADLFRSAQS